MAYYTLLVRESIIADGIKVYGDWEIAFGDFDKETVQSELEDYRDHFTLKSNLKIVKTRTARQSEIDNVLRKLNHSRL